MRRLAQVCLGMAMATCLMAAGPGLAAEAAGAPAQGAGAGARQVLVMLRLPPSHVLPNADYAGGYGGSMGRAARRRIALELARRHGLILVDDWPMPLLGVDCFIMAAPAGHSVEQDAVALSHEPGVAWAEPSHLYRAQGGATDTGDPLFRAQPAAGAWRLADLHEIATGRDVRVAVIDSRVQDDHPDLVGQIQLSRDFVADGSRVAEAHGTGVAGIIAAKAGNGLGIAGVAPQARLMALRACWQPPPGQGAAGTVCDSVSLAKALHFAIDRHAQVINLSLSGPADLLLGKLVDVAVERGITVVGAYDRAAPGGGFPASHSGVIAVVAESLEPPPAGVYSAPGQDVPTTQPEGRWFLVSGGSYAAAHVSGLFALMRQRNPGARNGLVLARAGARLGRIDACGSLLRAGGPCDCACARAPTAVAARAR